MLPAMRKLASLSLPGLVLVVACAGCNPIINIAGANFPAWLFCGIVGVVGAALFRPLFLALRIEPYLWPLPVVYSSLSVLVGCVVYLIFFRN